MYNSAQPSFSLLKPKSFVNVLNFSTLEIKGEHIGQRIKKYINDINEVYQKIDYNNQKIESTQAFKFQSPLNKSSLILNLPLL